LTSTRENKPSVEQIPPRNYRLRLLAEAERCKARGQLGAFLRREGLYSSMLANWKKQVGKAELAALAPKKRGPKANPGARQIQQLNRDNARLRRELDRAKLIIDAQKQTVRGVGSADRGRDERGRVMVAVAELAAHVGLRTACLAFSLNRGFVYRDRARRRTTVSRRGTRVRARPPLAFSNAEQDVLLALRSPSLRHRPHDTRVRALRNGRCSHTAARCHPRRRVRRESDPLQGGHPETARTAHRRVDQSAEKGLDTDSITPGCSLIS
jgi:transposase-like protein